MTSDPAAKDGSGHTPAPWETLPAARSNLIHIETSGGHSAICSLSKSQSANARRIVACVNYCEGVPTELLEGHPSDLKTVSDLAIRNGERADVLESDRDRLRERVKELENALQKIANHDGVSEIIARIALSKSPK